MKYLIVFLIVLSSCSNKLKTKDFNNEYGNKMGNIKLNYERGTFYLKEYNHQYDYYILSEGAFINRGDTILLKTFKDCSCDFDISEKLRSKFRIQSNSNDLKLLRIGKKEHYFKSSDTMFIVSHMVDSFWVNHLHNEGIIIPYHWELPTNYYDIVIKCDIPKSRTEGIFKSKTIILLENNTYRILF